MEISGGLSGGLPPLRPNRTDADETSRDPQKGVDRDAQAGEQELEEVRGQLRQDVFLEVRRLPDADEEVEIAEVREELGGESILVAVEIVKEKIPLKPDEAARAQANLNPQRIAGLLQE